MANLACWQFTQLPIEIVEILEKDIHQFNENVQPSQVAGSVVDTVIRNSKNSWVPTSHWISGWLSYYVNKINRENFCYDLIDIDGGSLQYTQYGEGNYYNWHTDQDVDSFYKPQLIPSSAGNISQDLTTLQGECVRKLSFTVQLSNPEDYSGGEVQFLDNNNQTFFAPKRLGTIIVFDSRIRHRVRKVKSGVRKSIVGWCVGPRWK